MDRDELEKLEFLGLKRLTEEGRGIPPIGSIKRVEVGEEVPISGLQNIRYGLDIPKIDVEGLRGISLEESRSPEEAARKEKKKQIAIQMLEDLQKETKTPFYSELKHVYGLVKNNFSTIATPIALLRAIANNAESVYKFSKRLEESNLLPKEEEFRFPIIVPQNPMKPLGVQNLYYFDFDTKEVIKRQTTHEQLWGAKNWEEAFKAWGAASYEGAKKVLKREEWYSFPVMVKELFPKTIYPKAKWWQTAPLVLGAAVLDLATDPFVFLYGRAASMFWHAAGKVWQSATKAAPATTAIVKYSPTVNAFKSAFNLWSGAAHTIRTRGLQVTAEEKVMFERKFSPYIRDISKSYDSVLEEAVKDKLRKQGKNPELNNRLIRQEAQEVAKKIYEITRRTWKGERGQSQALSKAISEAFPGGVSAKHRSAIYDFMRRTRAFYNLPEIKEAKSRMGLKEETYTEKPYYLPYTELGEITRWRRKPFIVTRHQVPLSQKWVTIEKFEDYLNYTNTYARRIEPNIPQVIALDTFGVIDKAYRKKFIDDTINFLVDSNAAWKIPSSVKTKTKELKLEGVDKDVIDRAINFRDDLNVVPVIKNAGYILPDGKQLDAKAHLSVRALYPEILPGDPIKALEFDFVNKFMNDTASARIFNKVTDTGGEINIELSAKGITSFQVEALKDIVKHDVQTTRKPVKLVVDMPKVVEVLGKRLSFPKKLGKRVTYERYDGDVLTSYIINGVVSKDISSIFGKIATRPKTVTRRVPIKGDINRIMVAKLRGSESIKLSQFTRTRKAAVDNQINQLLEWKRDGVKKEVIGFFEKEIGLNLSNPKEVAAFLYSHTLWRPMGETATFSPEGKKYKAITTQVPSYIVDEQVSSYIRSTNQTMFTPEIATKFINFSRRIHAPFKFMAIGIYPYFAPKYYQTNMMQIVKGGMKIEHIPWRLTQGLMIKALHNTKLGNTLKVRVGNEHYPIKDFYKLAENVGVPGRIRSLLSEKEMKWLYDMVMNHLSPTFLRGLERAKDIPYGALMGGDDVYRLGLFLDRLNKTASAGAEIPKPEELKHVIGDLPWEETAKRYDAFFDAGGHTYTHMYDYQVSPFAQKVLKPVFPFFAWYNQNIPAMIKMFLTQWDVLEKIARGKQILEDLFPIDEKYKPPYAKEFRYELKIPIEGTDRKFHAYFSVPMPYKDISKFLFARDSLGNIFAMAGVYTALISAFLGLRFFPTVEEYKEGKYIEAPVWAAPIAKLGIGAKVPGLWGFKVFPETGEVRLMMNERFVRFVEGIAPSANHFKRVFAEHASIRVMLDFDELEKQKKTIRKYEDIAGKEVSVPTTYYSIEGLRKGVLKTAPPVREETLIAWRLRRFMPSLLFTVADEEKVRIQKIQEVIRFIEKRQMLKMEDGGYLLPITVDTEEIFEQLGELY